MWSGAPFSKRSQPCKLLARFNQEIDAIVLQADQLLQGRKR